MMKKLLAKEFRLSASPLSYLFVLFGAMTMIPNYPILVCAFFVCFGIFHTFQQVREFDDITFSVLLPVRKRDIVYAKYGFTAAVQLCAFALCLALTLVRLTALKDSAIYAENPLMNANLAYLGYVLLVFGLFNVVFLGGFFKTAYGLGWPFLRFGIACFVAIGVGEALHHFPGLGSLNAQNQISAPQVCVLALGAAFYVAGTALSAKLAASRFERIDL